MKKKLLALLLGLTLCLSLAACGGSTDDTAADDTADTAGDDAAETVTLTVAASPTPHAVILEQCVPILAEQGIDLVINEYSDYVVPNTAVEDGDEDANYFQHIPYLEEFNETRGTHLVDVASVHIEPMGVYAGKTASLEELADGAVIAITNDATNEGRALLLLEAQGLITLDDSSNLSATPNNIVDNPKNLQFEEIEAQTLPSSRPDLDLAVINSNYALGAGLNPTTDALAIESSDSPYVNVLVVKEGNEDNEAVQALVEALHSDVMEKVLSQMDSYDYAQYTARDVRAALEHETCTIEDFKALLSPAAEPFLEEMAQRACLETKKHFGNTVYLFTPLYIANYCENYCVYCGFNCYNHIHRMKLSMEQIEHEMEIIAQSGMEEILLLTGESRSMSSVEYIGQACKLARKYFRMVGLEIYPVNTDEYRYLHECGADYVTVFQETYDRDKYETLHLMGHKRVWPYRFDAQERALRGGMRGVAFSALLGLADFRKDALASALHVYYLQRKYPAAEMSLSCPRLRPIINNDKINPLDVGERQLCQVLCAYRIFLPFVGITVSSREDAAFRNGIVRIAATKVSAGVSTGIGDHESKYQGKEAEDAGDEQFEISDSRSLSQMYQDMAAEGLQPVLNDYLYV